MARLDGYRCDMCQRICEWNIPIVQIRRPSRRWGRYGLLDICPACWTAIQRYVAEHMESE